MPFKSKAQRRKFAQLLVDGKITDETYEEWNKSTGGRELPERVDKKAAARRSTKKRPAKKRAAAKKPAAKRSAAKRPAQKRAAKARATKRQTRRG